jgi:hypothetical protein
MGDLLLLSPPGQINDCYNDLISLGQVDMGLFKQYNINQSIPIKTQDGVIVLGPDSVWQDDLLLFNNSTYQVDHVKLEAHVVQQGTPDADPTRYDKRICTSTRIKLEWILTNCFREALEKQVGEYVDNYYPTGQMSVYKTDLGWTIYIVGNQYNPNNFWYDLVESESLGLVVGRVLGKSEQMELSLVKYAFKFIITRTVMSN